MKFENKTDINDIIKALNSIEAAIEDKEDSSNKLFSKENKEQERYKALDKSITEIKKLLSEDKNLNIKNNKNLSDILKKISDNIKKQATLSDIKTNINSLISILENSQKSNEKLLSELSTVLNSKFNRGDFGTSGSNTTNNTITNNKTVIVKGNNSGIIENKAFDNLVLVTKDINNKFSQLLLLNNSVSNFLSDTNDRLLSREKLEYEKFKLEKFKDKDSKSSLGFLENISKHVVGGGLVKAMTTGLGAVVGSIGVSIAKQVKNFLGFGKPITKTVEGAKGAKGVTTATEVASTGAKTVEGAKGASTAAEAASAGTKVTKVSKLGNVFTKIMGTAGKFGRVLGKAAGPLAILTAGWDAYQGWNNSDKYFDGNKEEHTATQKTASALTSVLDMGGLTTSIFKFFGRDFDTKAIAQKLFGWMDGLQKWWSEKIMPSLSKLGSELMKIYDIIKSVCESIWNVIKPAINFILDIQEKIRNFLIDFVMDYVMPTIGDGFEGLINIITGAATWIREGLEDAKKYGGMFIDWIKTLPQKILDSIGKLFGVDNLYKTVSDSVGKWIDSMLNGIIDGINKLLPSIFPKIPKIGKGNKKPEEPVKVEENKIKNPIENKEPVKVEENKIKNPIENKEQPSIDPAMFTNANGAAYGAYKNSNGDLVRKQNLKLDNEGNVVLSDKLTYDCSQYVSALLHNMGKEGFVDSKGNALDSRSIRNKLLKENGGMEKNLADAKEGDVIFLEPGEGSKISHVAMTYTDQKTGKLMVTDSRGGKGVSSMSYEDYQKKYGNRMHLLNNSEDPSKIQQVAYSEKQQKYNRAFNNNIIGSQKPQEIVVNNVTSDNSNRSINSSNKSDNNGYQASPILVVNPVSDVLNYGGLYPRV